MSPRQTIIVTKATDLFRLYGIKAITMAEIAHECGISTKTLYHCFDTKDTLVQMVVANLATTYLQEFAALRQLSASAVEEMSKGVAFAEQIFLQMNHRMLVEMRRYYPFSWKKLITFRNGYMRDAILANLNRGQREGHYSSDMNSQQLATRRLRQLIAIHNDTRVVWDNGGLRQILTASTNNFLLQIMTPEGAAILQQAIQPQPEVHA